VGEKLVFFNGPLKPLVLLAGLMVERANFLFSFLLPSKVFCFVLKLYSLPFIFESSYQQLLITTRFVKNNYPKCTQNSSFKRILLIFNKIITDSGLLGNQTLKRKILKI
jgi:hypothetical protein